ncbi:MAG: hypothetical protein GX628_00280 [Clostridiales bacterium]|nr:hypothetical protein [Clostridiales bacterium]
MKVHAELFMPFINPTRSESVKAKYADNPALSSALSRYRSIQGFTAYGDCGFVFFHTGICGVYDLAARNPEPTGVFLLGSYNEGDPDSRYTNHANQAMFPDVTLLECSRAFYPGNSDFPLLRVTTGNSGEADDTGYIARCAVENVTLDRETGVFTSETVQTIAYCNSGIENTSYETPCWGWPAWVADVEKGRCYIFSARYRTKKEFLDKYDINAYIVTEFALPEMGEKGGTVILRPGDILDQFTLPFNVLFTQGGMLREGRIYHTFGAGTETYPNALRVIDLAGRRFEVEADLSQTCFADEEIECCAFFRGRMLVNTQGGKLYTLDFQ